MSDIEKPKRAFPGYQPLANVLQDALDQAQAGKGSQRHANGKPFLEQPIITDGRACGLAGPAFQARKKILEALNCPDEERAVQDLLGAIVYTAAMVILKKEERTVKESLTVEPWQSAIPEQDVQRRERAATGSPAMDTLAEACGMKKVDVSPLSFELDAEPVEPGRIYRVPDRTSRATLPDECLGALCGRAGR